MTIRDTYKKIDDSFETGFENISDKELSHIFNNAYPGIPPKFRDPKYYTEMERQKISLEMTRRLKQEIQDFNMNSSKQSKVMIGLTWVIVILTIVLAIPLFNQFLIWLINTFFTRAT